MGDLEVLELAGFAVVAVVTSAITAVSGLGGGIILLAVMLLVLDPLVAIPLHAAIQLASNSTRTLRLRDEVEWPYAIRFAVPLLPAAILGLVLASGIPADLGPPRSASSPCWRRGGRRCSRSAATDRSRRPASMWWAPPPAC